MNGMNEMNGEGYIMRLRRRICKDVRHEMNRLGIRFWLETMNSAIDYICMVNDLEFNGSYEYQGEDWVRDTMMNYPEVFRKEVLL